MTQHYSVSLMLCACAYFTTHSPIREYLLCSFILGQPRHPCQRCTAFLRTVFTCCSASGLGVWACYYRNHTEGQNRGEEGEMLTYEWRVGTSQWCCCLWLVVKTNYPAHPTVSSLSSFLLQNPWLLLLLLLLALSHSLYLCVYWVIVSDAVVHV